MRPGKMSIVVMSIMLLCLLTSCSKGSDYKILYGKVGNKIHPMQGKKSNCMQMGFYEFMGGGIVNSNGSKNIVLDVEKYPMMFPRSKKFKNYYYINAKSSPIEERQNFSIYNFNAPDQKIETAGFKELKSKKLIGPTKTEFPSAIITSPKNEFLVYLMTDKPKNKSISNHLDPFRNDSDIMIRGIEDGKDGKDVKAIEATYNRALFDSFSNFSKEGDSFYTILRDGGAFKFVKVDLASGRAAGFKELFKTFNWDKIDWGKFFKKRQSNYAHFSISPDEEVLLAYKNEAGFDPAYCFNTMTHTLYLLDIKNDKIEIISEGEGGIYGVTWKEDSEGFAYIKIIGGGCYPSYLNSSINRMDKRGGNADKLVVEDKSKITNLSWSPDAKLIAYSVYGEDLIGRIKTVDPKNKKVKDVVSTKDTEKTIDKNAPVTLIFADWVAK